MGRRTTTIIGACAAVALTAGALAAQGVLPDRATIVTVSGPVSLPGVTLPAGSYLFRLADTQASRNVVQIFDRDRTKIFATLIAVPAERDEASGEALITFKETPSDRPPAVHYWFYAGEKSGQEFAYPKEQARMIASASGESVLSIDTASTDIDAMKSGEMSRVEPSAASPEAASREAQQPSAAQPPSTTTPPSAQPSPTPRTQPEPQAAAPATPQSTPEPRPDATPPATTPATPESAAQTPATRTPSTGMQPTGTSGRTAARGELPRTASELPIVGLIGFLALGAAFAVRGLRSRLMV